MGEGGWMRIPWGSPKTLGPKGSRLNGGCQSRGYQKASFDSSERGDGPVGKRGA